MTRNRSVNERRRIGVFVSNVPRKSEWYEEFQRANQAPAPSGRPEDRREHARFEPDDANTIVFRRGLLTLVGMRRTIKAMVTLDLSTGGVRVLIKRRLKPKTKVKVKIQMEKYKDSIETTGVIQWCFQNKSNSKEFYAGIKFEDMDDTQTRKLGRMRDWFTSPQYKAVRDSKMKPDESGLGVLKIKE